MIRPQRLAVLAGVTLAMFAPSPGHAIVAIAALSAAGLFHTNLAQLSLAGRTSSEVSDR